MRAAPSSRRRRACDLPCRLLPRSLSREESSTPPRDRVVHGEGSQPPAVPRDVIGTFQSEVYNASTQLSSKRSLNVSIEADGRGRLGAMARQTIREVAE